MSSKAKQPKEISPEKRGTALMVAYVIALAVLFLVLYGVLPPLTSVTYDTAAPIGIRSSMHEEPSGPPLFVVTHRETPKFVRGIYMTACVAATPYLRDRLVDLMNTSEINTVVINIKDETGRISFSTDDEELTRAQSSECFVRDMREFIALLHRNGIYVIGRISVFQDKYYVTLHPELAVTRASATTTLWKDYKGLSFIDVGARPFWEYIFRLGHESYKAGFDELNFDYIRFPSDGPMSDIYFPWSVGKEKAVALEEFFSALSASFKDTPVKISADLFGMTTTNTDDLFIGQVLERALPYFDFIDPMVYPSHYPPNFHGFPDPNKKPYEVVHYSLSEAVRRAQATSTSIGGLALIPIASTSPRMYAKEDYGSDVIRPWLQDFDYGSIYDIPEVRAQIQATYDAGATSWLLWSPSNVYTRGAFEDEDIVLSTSTESTLDTLNLNE